VFDAQSQDVMDMFIVQSVQDIAPVFAEPHQTASPQQLQLLTDGALLHPELLADGIHPPLTLFEEEEDFQAGGIAEDFEEIGYVHDFLFQGENYLIC
jgi:hypothetical protein